MAPILPIGMRALKFHSGLFVASAFDINNTGDSTANVVMPYGTVDDDLMEAGDYVMGGISINTLPGGWTNKNDSGFFTLDGQSTRVYIDTKSAGASETGPYTWNLSGGSGIGIHAILTYRPTSPTQLDVVTEGTNFTGTTHTAPNSTTVDPQTRMLSAFVLNRIGTGAFTVTTPPSGMVEVFDQDATSIGLADRRLVIYDEIVHQPGLYTGKSMTISNSAESRRYNIGIKARGAYCDL